MKTFKRFSCWTLCFGMALVGSGVFAQDEPPEKPKPTVIAPLENSIQPSSDTVQNNGPTSPSRVLPGERPVHKNYWLPLLEIPAFIALWNRFDRIAFTSHDYDSTWATGWDHV